MGLAALRQAAERTQVELARVYRCDLRPVCQVSSAVDPLLPVPPEGARRASGTVPTPSDLSRERQCHPCPCGQPEIMCTKS